MNPLIGEEKNGLNIACGVKPMPGYTNVDKHQNGDPRMVSNLGGTRPPQEQP